MPGADLATVASAIAFGLRLNGGAVCMSPRRLLATSSTLHALKPLLQRDLDKVTAVGLPEGTAERLHGLLDDAVLQGAALLGAFQPTAQKPLLIDNATPNMAIAQNDIFAPVLSLLAVESMMHVLDAYSVCPYALTLSIFCGKNEVKQGLALARTLRAGTVLINDLIAPTADPRVPFGGRGASGYGVTRGAEGLLEMTAVKTVLVRRSGVMRHLVATSEADVPLFAAMIAASHGEGWTSRWRAVRNAVRAARDRRRK
jgi:aldehyde dehydrogenase (NAD+)